MRYYLINLRRPARAAAGNQPAVPAAVLGSYRTQNPLGQVLPNALDVDFDIPVSDFATPMSGGYVRIYGVDLGTLIQASDFNLKEIEVYGGMQRGLPLAKAQQAGLLMAGTIQQAFGNWVGTEMTLDLIYTAGTTQPETPVNLTIDWRAGQLLADAIRATLRSAFPGYTASINISPRLVLQHDQPGFYGTPYQFARYIREVSRSIIRDEGYPGVRILLRDRKFVIQDATTRTTPARIDFNDLVGQITWLSANTLSITTVMRADLQTGDFLLLPANLSVLQTLTTPQSQSQARAKDPFAGVFQINNVRHTGRFRGSGGQSWVSTFQVSGPIRNV